MAEEWHLANETLHTQSVYFLTKVFLSPLTNDVKNVEDNYFLPLLLCLQNIIVFITSLAVMIYLSPLVMLCLFVAVLLLIALPSLFQKAIQNRQDSFSKNQSNFTVAIKDFLSGFEVIRSYRMNSHTAKAFGENYDQVIFMENGVISETGSYAKLMENRGAFSDFVSLKK